MTHQQEDATDASLTLLQHLAARQNVAPKRLVPPGPTDAQLKLIFTAASHAPDHGRLQPWRFILVPATQRALLGQAFVTALEQRDAHPSNEQREAAYEKAFRAPCLMLAVINATPSDPMVPLTERLISLGCAIQNMLLMAETLSIGSGITSGQAMNAPSIRALFELTADEEGVCFINFGTVSARKPPRTRATPESFVSSLPAQVNLA
jgi:nitroreductase